MQYETAHERPVKILIITLTLLWHILIIYTLFVLTRQQDLEPLRLTPQPQLVEYLLHSLATQQAQQSQLTVQTQPALMRNQPSDEPEPGVEHYTVKNAVSFGSCAQGSVVGQAEENLTEPSQFDNNEPQATHPENEPATDTGKSNEQQSTPQTTATPSINTQESLTTKNSSEHTDIFDDIQAIVDRTGSSWITAGQQNNRAQTSTEPLRASVATNKIAQEPAPQVKKQLSLADITRSYIHQVKKEHEATGNYTYHSASNSQGSSARYGAYVPPTNGIALSEQIYASKLYSLLEQSAMAYSSQIYACKDMEMETIIEVTIEKSGKILDVTLKPELPEKDLHNALCLIVKRVGLFPPIPKQFHKQRIILSIPIHIKSKQGFASYHLLYGLHSA